MLLHRCGICASVQFSANPHRTANDAYSIGKVTASVNFQRQIIGIVAGENELARFGVHGLQVDEFLDTYGVKQAGASTYWFWSMSATSLCLMSGSMLSLVTHINTMCTGRPLRNGKSVRKS